MAQAQSVDKKTADATKRLWRVISHFLTVLHSEHHRDPNFTLASRLNQDLGLDSLSRAELFTRIEHEFNVVLPNALLTESETIRDLIDGVLLVKAHPGSTAGQMLNLSALTPHADTPIDETTLLGVLNWHVNHHTERPHVILWDKRGRDSVIHYGQLASKARTVAGALLARGVVPGDRIALMLPTGADFLFAFFGILGAGCVPVPIYPPTRLSQIADHLRRQVGILDNADVAALVTRGIATTLRVLVASLRFVCTVKDLTHDDHHSAFAAVQGSDLALLQYTSGSTGDPKGVMLTHANLLANIRETGRAASINSTDIAVSWLPLYHDMGLIGTWLGALYFGVPSVIMSPLTFLARPAQWLWAITRYRATISAAPNFGFDLCVRKVTDEAIRGLDLSSLRLLMNGAEPVSSKTVRQFTKRFHQYGFRPEAMTPVYGMAECALALTIPRSNRKPRVDRIHRKELTDYGVAIPQNSTEKGGIEILACGQPLSGHEIRVISPYGDELPERREGHLQFCGPSASNGYFRNKSATAALLNGRWRNSGDRGYISEGEIFVTGRSKDIIIRAGCNIYPHEIEEAVGNVEGIRKGCVAVFGCTGTESGTERLILVAETRETLPDQLNAIRNAIREVLNQYLDISADEIYLVPPHSVPKTSSGKVRRHQTRNLYQEGVLGQSHAGFRQAIRFATETLTYQGRLILAQVARKIYGAYAATVVAIGVLLGLPWVWILPTLKLRWTVTRYICRIVLRLIGITIHVHGLGHILGLRCITVANHTSYLDAFLLCAILPDETTFVVKGELRDHWIISVILRKLGALFVERLQTSRGIEDNQTAVKRVLAGKRLHYFPEGTFSRRPGLVGFRMGAFVASTTTGMPILPIALRGARSILRDGSFRASFGSVEVRIGPAISPTGSDFESSARLRDDTRKWILQHCGEPDLTERTPPTP